MTIYYVLVFLAGVIVGEMIVRKSRGWIDLKRLLCWLGFHCWTKWYDDHSPTMFRFSQSRRCLWCGEEQERFP